MRTNLFHIFEIKSIYVCIIVINIIKKFKCNIMTRHYDHKNARSYFRRLLAIFNLAKLNIHIFDYFS